MIVKTLAELAKQLGVTPRTARNWRRAGMPALSGGAGFDVDQVEAWRKSVRYLRSSLRAMEEDHQNRALFESAVRDLRRGLLHLCESFVKARGGARARLIDRAVRDILHGAARQQELLEKEGGGAA